MSDYDIVMEVNGIKEPTLFQLGRVIVLREVILLKSHILFNEVVKCNIHLCGLKILSLKGK